MDKEKQIEEMAETLYQGERNRCTHISCHDCHYDANNDDFCREKAIAEYLYDAGYRKQSEWISVDERLPHWSDGKVLVFTEYGFSICERTVNGRWQGKHANWITHWMPLPEAPKMKGGAE